MHKLLKRKNGNSYVHVDLDLETSILQINIEVTHFLVSLDLRIISFYFCL